MNKATIDKFIEGLISIPEKDFSVENIFDYLAKTPIDADSLAPYLNFSKKCYTRNLVYKNELFEVMTLCWDVGQCSRIHNHHEQMCWMSVPVGKLKGQNFKQLKLNEATNYCKIEESNDFILNIEQPASVEMDEPIHQILNLPEYNERAVSVHIYSKPFDRCLVYSKPKNEVSEVQLFYSSMFGRLCDGVSL